MVDRLVDISCDVLKTKYSIVSVLTPYVAISTKVHGPLLNCLEVDYRTCSRKGDYRVFEFPAKSTESMVSVLRKLFCDDTEVRVTISGGLCGEVTGLTKPVGLSYSVSELSTRPDRRIFTAIAERVSRLERAVRKYERGKEAHDMLLFSLRRLQVGRFPRILHLQEIQRLEMEARLAHRNVNICREELLNLNMQVSLISTHFVGVDAATEIRSILDKLHDGQFTVENDWL